MQSLGLTIKFALVNSDTVPSQLRLADSLWLVNKWAGLGNHYCQSTIGGTRWGPDWQPVSLVISRPQAFSRRSANDREIVGT